MEKKELNKHKRKSIYLLFVEFVAMPMMAVSVAVLIAAIATYDSSPSRYELYAIAMNVVAIPFLAMSVFFRKAVVALNPKLISKKEPESIQWAEAFGIGASVVGVCYYIASVKVLLALLFLISVCVAFTMHIRYFIKARDN